MTLDVEDRLRRTLHDVASRLEVGDDDLNDARRGPVASRPRWRPLAIAAVVVLVVGAAAALTGLGRETDDAASVVAGPDPGVTTTPPASSMADTSWTLAILSSDGMTLEITVGIQPAGEGPCEQQFRYEVTETEHAVTVAFAQVEQTTTATEPVACEDVLQPQSFEIELDSPLGDRALYDGVQPQPRQVWRLAEVVVPTVLPDGVTADDLGRSPGTDFGPVHWTQHAVVPSGPGWDLLIDQGRAGSFTPPSGDVIATTEIHGNEATIYEYFNHTGHMVHWTEGGLDLTVRAELHTVNMSEPRSFANPDVAFIDDVLLQVADGIAIP